MLIIFLKPFLIFLSFCSAQPIKWFTRKYTK